jgi:NADPH-dependent 2,4-dienoyl-CoA reductase/sulfur reductase-like enzyme
MLGLWHADPTQALSLRRACASAPAVLDSEAAQAAACASVHAFLSRHGHINSGVFRPDPDAAPPPPGRRVLVVGAGMAGVACARQLAHMGHRVTLLEARDRVGGRIAVQPVGGMPADLGAMIVTGVEANPVSMLCKQVCL